MSGRGVIGSEPSQVCELCGIIDECRPYGPNGEQVCFDCGMKDEKNAHKRMLMHIFGESEEDAAIIAGIPVLENEETWASRVIDETCENIEPKKKKE